MVVVVVVAGVEPKSTQNNLSRGYNCVLNKTYRIFKFVGMHFSAFNHNNTFVATKGRVRWYTVKKMYE